MAEDAGWSATYTAIPHFTLKAYLAPQRASERPILVYLEGDGFSWINENWVSPDPTPRTPFMLQVALQDSHYNAAYLARPCQYVIEAGYGANCQSALWTDARFNQVVIADMSKALDQILLERAQTRVILVGGSGGATVAMLLAAQRKDIAGVVTLSGLLNHRAWTKCHKISDLAQSLDLTDFYPQIASMPQMHLLASNDGFIPVQLSIQQLVRLTSLSTLNTIRWREVPKMEHSCCWGEYWKDNHQIIIDGILKLGPYIE